MSNVYPLTSITPEPLRGEQKWDRDPEHKSVRDPLISNV